MYLLLGLQFRSPPCLNASVVYNNCHSIAHLIPGGGHVPHPAEEWSAELMTSIQNRNSNVLFSDKPEAWLPQSLERGVTTGILIYTISLTHMMDSFWCYFSAQSVLNLFWTSENSNLIFWKSFYKCFCMSLSTGDKGDIESKLYR